MTIFSSLINETASYYLWCIVLVRIGHRRCHTQGEGLPQMHERQGVWMIGDPVRSFVLQSPK